MSFNGSISINQNIQVVVRCRPPNPHEQDSILNFTDNEVKLSRIEKAFVFDRVFDDTASQFDVYKTVAEPLIKQVLLGFNCTIFAYGQTGTGKTYTMEGKHSDTDATWEDDPDSGIIPRSLNHLFDVLTKQENDYAVHVSFLELYNEEAYDLLGSPDESLLTKLKIYDDANKKGSVIIGGLKETNVKSKSEIYDIFRLAASKRQTAATQLNACSSRSHTIFSVTVRLKEGSLGGGDELLRIGKLNLVDLAGSECVGRSGAKAVRAREAGNINQSLLTLGRVITALVEKAPHIPYRESKLTRILQDSLGGTTKTSIIATISPAITDLEDTCSTLEYAQRAKKITNKPEINQQLKQERSTIEYHQEIQTLHDRYQCELSAMEMKIRNEITDEWKAANAKLELQYNQSTQEMLAQHKIDLAKCFAELQSKDEEIQSLKQAGKQIEEAWKLKYSKLEKELDESIAQHKLETEKLNEKIHSLEGLIRISEEKYTLLDERHKKRELMFEDQISINKSTQEILAQHKIDIAKYSAELQSKDEEIQSLKQAGKQIEEAWKLKYSKLEKELDEPIAQHKLETEKLNEKIHSLERLIRISEEKYTLQDERHKKRELMFEDQISQLELELKKVKPVEDNTSNSPTTSRVTQKRVRKIMPTVTESEYANITFDDMNTSTDEIAQFTKKPSRKRTIKTPQANGLSGKKRRIQHEKADAAQLSPLEQPIARATRSRARKKLDF